MPERIAAIITCRDLGHTLVEALESAERQTRPAAEIVVVDDGSTEMYTQQLLARLARDGTRVVQAGGRGVCVARNLGAQITSAGYLVWIDADDILEPTYFETAAAVLDADAELDFVSSALRAFGAATYTWKPASPNLVDVISTGAYPHASTMIRRRLWETVGRFDESLPLFELLDFWATAIARGCRGVVLDEPFLNYRIRPDSRYRRMIQPDAYVSRLAHFYEKHRDAIEPHALELINGKEAFLQGQRSYHLTLETRATSLEAELAQLEGEVAKAATALESHRVSRAAGGSATAMRPASHRAVILAYHRIAELTLDSHGLCTPPDVFREHMARLREHFSPIGLDDLVQAAAEGRIPERAVAVTLDDGYLDALTVASPILTELGVPATFFVNTDRLDEEHERWWDILERVFLGEARVPPLLELTLGGFDLRLPTATFEQRGAALKTLNEKAWPLDAMERDALASHVLAWSGADGRARATHRVLTGEEIHALADRPGHAIGAHTTRHLALTVHSAETKRKEVFENKVTLERLLERPVHQFSYPYGDFDAETLALVNEARFHGAVTVQPGTVSAGANRLLLPRHEVTPQTQDRFALRMREIFAS